VVMDREDHEGDHSGCRGHESGRQSRRRNFPGRPSGADEDGSQDRTAADAVDSADAAHHCGEEGQHGQGNGARRPRFRSGPGRASQQPSGTSTAATIRSKTRATFTPRGPVELAGGQVTAGSFLRSARTGSAYPPTRRSASSRRTYVIQCPYCQRRFTRVTPDTSLREHKDGYGNRCGFALSQLWTPTDTIRTAHRSSPVP